MIVMSMKNDLSMLVPFQKEVPRKDAGRKPKPTAYEKIVTIY